MLCQTAHTSSAACASQVKPGTPERLMELVLVQVRVFRVPCSDIVP